MSNSNSCIKNREACLNALNLLEFRSDLGEKLAACTVNWQG